MHTPNRPIHPIGFLAWHRHYYRINDGLSYFYKPKKCLVIPKEAVSRRIDNRVTRQNDDGINIYL